MNNYSPALLLKVAMLSTLLSSTAYAQRSPPSVPRMQPPPPSSPNLQRIEPDLDKGIQPLPREVQPPPISSPDKLERRREPGGLPSAQPQLPPQE